MANQQTSLQNLWYQVKQQTLVYPVFPGKPTDKFTQCFQGKQIDQFTQTFPGKPTDQFIQTFPG